MSWFTKNSSPFFTKVISSMWDSLQAKWDSTRVKWDGQAVGSWYGKNNSEWYD